MLPLIEHVVDQLIAEVGRLAAVTPGRAVDFREAFGRFSMDAVASCAFGVDAKSFAAKTRSPFVAVAEKILMKNSGQFLKLVRRLNLLHSVL